MRTPTQTELKKFSSEAKKVLKPKKSKAAKKVLKYMDMDVSYSASLKMVLLSDKRLSKKKLEKELDFYILI